MSERVKITSKTPELKRDNSVSRIRKTDSSQSTSSPIDHILSLQRTIGNQAVQRLFKSGVIQAKLKIGQPNDIYEQEADRVAEQVMRMPEPCLQRQVEEEEEELIQTKPLAEQVTPLVQRQMEEKEEIQTKREESFIQQQVEEEEEMLQSESLSNQIRPLIQRQVEPEEEEEETIQAKEIPDHATGVTPDLESRIMAIKGRGHPLPELVRTFFEPRFGYDFSKVRIHSNPMAAEMAKVLSARAFTTGRDVVFGAGQYAPETDAGKRLLAHELTHVAQQRGSSIRRKFTIDQPSEQCQQKSPRVARVLVKNRHHTIMKAGKQTEETLRVKFDECPVHSGIGSLHVKDQSTSLVAKEVTMDTFATLQTKEAGESVAETVTRPKLEFEIPLKRTPYGDITIKFEGEPVTAPPRGVPGATRLEMVLGKKLKLKVKTNLLNISIAEWQTKLDKIGFEGKVFIEPFEIVKAGKKLEVILLKVGLKARNTNIEEWSGIKFTFQLQFKVTAEKVLTKANRLLFKKIVA